jgi:hypothetical protein
MPILQEHEQTESAPKAWRAALKLSKGQLPSLNSLRSMHTRCAWRCNLHPQLRVDRVSFGVSSSLHASRIQTCSKS